MNRIVRIIHGGDLILELLENGFEDLRDGEEYVHINKNKKVVSAHSQEASGSEIAKVLWGYNVKDRATIICKFDEPYYNAYKQHFLEPKLLKGWIG